MRRYLFGMWGTVVWALMLTGCSIPITEMEDAPRFPFPVKSLTAEQSGGGLLLTWQPDARNVVPQKYRIYRDFKLLDEVPARQTNYMDHADGGQVYFVEPVMKDGKVSMRPGVYFRCILRPQDGADVHDDFWQSVLADPSVAGLDLIMFWNEVEPEQGQLDFSLFEDALAECDRYGKKAILQVFPGQTGEFADWQEKLFTILVDQPRPGQVKLDGRPQTPRRRLYPLDEDFRREWRRFNRQLAEQFDADSRVDSVNLHGPSTMSTHMRIPSSEAGRQEWEALGFTIEKWKQAWVEDSQEFLSHWTHKQVMLNYGHQDLLGPAVEGCVLTELFPMFGNQIVLRNECANGNAWYVNEKHGGTWNRVSRPFFRQWATDTLVGYEMWKFSWDIHAGADGFDKGPNGPMGLAPDACLADSATWVQVWPQDYRKEYIPLYRDFAVRVGYAFPPIKEDD